MCGVLPSDTHTYITNPTMSDNEQAQNIESFENDPELTTRRHFLHKTQESGETSVPFANIRKQRALLFSVCRFVRTYDYRIRQFVGMPPARTLAEVIATTSTVIP